MVRWKIALVLTVLLLLPRISAKSDDDEDDDRRGEEADEEDEEDEDDEEEESAGGGGDKPLAEDGHKPKDHNHRPASVTMPSDAAVRRTPILMPSPKTPISGVLATRTLKKRPLECYVCAYKAETPLRACLDPIKFRVHTITCHTLEDRCFTSVIPKGNSFEAVVRGCRSGCVGTAETTCCEHNRCNNQAFAPPLVQPKVTITGSGEDTSYPLLAASSKSNMPPSIMFFVSLMLMLQTAMKVAFI